MSGSGSDRERSRSRRARSQSPDNIQKSLKRTGKVYKVGDWSCPKCGDHQFARNVKCRMCDTPKPGEKAGDIDDPPQPSSKLQWVDKIKRGQRDSVAFKDRWWKFCDTNGNGFYDPSRHEAKFLQDFLDEEPESDRAGAGGGDRGGDRRRSQTARSRSGGGDGVGGGGGGGGVGAVRRRPRNSPRRNAVITPARRTGNCQRRNGPRRNSPRRNSPRRNSPRRGHQRQRLRLRRRSKVPHRRRHERGRRGGSNDGDRRGGRNAGANDRARRGGGNDGARRPGGGRGRRAAGGGVGVRRTHKRKAPSLDARAPSHDDSPDSGGSVGGRNASPLRRETTLPIEDKKIEAAEREVDEAARDLQAAKEAVKEDANKELREEEDRQIQREKECIEEAERQAEDTFQEKLREEKQRLQAAMITKMRVAELAFRNEAEVFVQETRQKVEIESRDAVEAAERRLLKEGDAKVDKAEARLRETRERLAELTGEPLDDPAAVKSPCEDDICGSRNSYDYSEGSCQDSGQDDIKS